MPALRPRRAVRRRGRKVRVCLESTGTYGLDLALALHRAVGIEVMVLNPRAARNFAKALMRRSKTDPIDARVLREYVRRMEFVPWHPPTIGSSSCEPSRAVSRA